MNPATLRHRIQIHGKIPFENELEEMDYKEGKLFEIWASIIPQTGSLQKQQAETVLANVTHKIIVRYNAGKNITNDMWIEFRNKRFDIKFILNPYISDGFLEIFCSEVIE